MKSKKYTHGKYNFTSYWKAVGEGWEVGFFYGRDPIFVGNFIHQSEATQWFKIMNREITSFSKKYPVGTKFPFAWYCNFIKNDLYKCYYGYLDRVFARYNRDFKKNVYSFQKKYSKMTKNWDRHECEPFFKKKAA